MSSENDPNELNADSVQQAVDTIGPKIAEERFSSKIESLPAAKNIGDAIMESDLSEGSSLHCRVFAKRKHVNYDRLMRPVSDRAARSARRRAFLKPSRLWQWYRRPHPEDKTPSIQYYIPPKTEKNKWGLTYSYLADLTETWVIQYVLWNYRTTFAKSILAFFFTFFVFIHIFALIIWCIVALYYSKDDQECLQGWQFQENPYDFTDNFILAFDSSWTTLTTVGYGTVSPPPHHKCTVLRFLLAFEAFVGILFASFCGAIFFTKLQRVEYSANIDFSSCMCLLYGTGLTDAVDIVQSVPGGSIEAPLLKTLASGFTVTSFPVIEMRLINERGGKRGQIVDASIECVATSLRLSNSSSLEGLFNPESERTFNLKSERTGFFNEGGIGSGIADGEVRTGGKSQRDMEIKRKHQELKITPSKHPYFSHGSWYFRHVLDENSPLLKSRVKKRIVESGGWPSDLNDHIKIRHCLSQDVFDILVVFKGTSNLTADSIFKMHTYTLEDIYIGWTFAQLGYIATKSVGEDDTGPDIKVDLSLIHDILPQRGGGSEPLGSRAPDPDILTFVTTHLAGT